MKFYTSRMGWPDARPSKELLLLPEKLIAIFKAHKTQIIMRINLIIIFSLFLLLQVNAEGFAQRISLKEKNASLETVLTEITKQTGMNVLVDGSVINQAGVIDVNFRRASVNEIFSAYFPGISFAFSIKNNTIVVSKSDPIVQVGNTLALFQVNIRGKVTDSKGISLPGASVKIKGTSQAVSTDANGEFSFSGLNENAILVISYTGFVTREVQAGNNPEITIALTEDVLALESVVVVGYGTQKKSNLTGAVDQVGSEYFEERPMANITRGLQGVLPNLNIKMNDGKPTRSAAYNIRGSTSISTSGPPPNALVLIDNVQGDPSNLNPNDIESVTILKDAASAAIYGSRGAFGVVLITTKSAKADRITVNYGTNYSNNQRTTTPDLVTDGYTWAKSFEEAFYAWNDYLTKPVNIDGKLLFSQAYLDELKKRSDDPSLSKYGIDASGNYAYYGSTDWMKELYRNSNSSMEHALSISGGTEKVRLVVSGRYFMQDGIFRYNPDKFNKYNLRAKGDIKINNWLSVNANLDYSNNDYRYPLTSQGGVHAVWRLLSASGYPVAPLLNEDGTLTNIASFSVGDYYQKKSFSQARTNVNRNTLGFTATPINKVSIRGDFSYLTTTTGDQRRYFPVTYSQKPGETISSGLNYLEELDEKEKSYVSNLYADYTSTIGNHSFKIMGGGNLESYTFGQRRTRRDGLLVENIVDWNLATGLNYVLTGGGNEWATAGLFYRANYGFKDKYLLELNGRYDGSSRFPQSQQFGFFPSASAAWVISREGFMAKTDNWLDQLKVRASYGSLGNGNINPYAFVETIGVGTSTALINGRFPNFIQRPNVYPNNITWEKATTLNLGLDVSILKSRLSASADIYQRKTSDMITVGPPLPLVFGAAVPNGNNADLLTKGFEISLNWRDQINTAKPIRYGVRLTLADNVAKITKFYNPNNLLSTYYVGYTLGEIRGFETVGFFKDAADVTSSPNQKNYFQVSPQNNILPGDIKFADLNGDGFVNIGKNTLEDPGDRRIIGNTSARYPYGIMGDMDWNNLSFSFFFQGVAKRDWMPGPEASYFWGQYNRPYSVMPSFNMDRWTPENPDPNAYFPRYRGFVALSGTRELAVPQTRYLQDASYIRLKNLTVGYSLPKSITQRIKANSVKLYLTGQNLWTWSPMYKITKNFDPEVIDGSDPEINSAGGDGFSYPMEKTFTVGLNVSF
ncbi:MAG: TonB-dependent receptor [Bacteroidota bacterium]